MFPRHLSWKFKITPVQCLIPNLPNTVHLHCNCTVNITVEYWQLSCQYSTVILAVFRHRARRSISLFGFVFGRCLKSQEKSLSRHPSTLWSGHWSRHRLVKALLNTRHFADVGLMLGQRARAGVLNQAVSPYQTSGAPCTPNSFKSCDDEKQRGWAMELYLSSWMHWCPALKKIPKVNEESGKLSQL